jgi:hypothetical protein
MQGALDRVRENLVHAYLVSGGTKENRERFAKEFSKIVFGGEISAPDLLEIPAYSIDEIREEIIPFLKKAPYSAERKLVIIRDAENMTDEAQNAFLKTLEEPTPDSVILMLTKEKSMLMDTIRSRAVSVILRGERAGLDPDILDAAKKLISKALSKKPISGAFDLLASILTSKENKKTDPFDKEKTLELLEYMERFIRDLLAARAGAEGIVSREENVGAAKMTPKKMLTKMMTMPPIIAEARKNISMGYNNTWMVKRMMIQLYGDIK